MNRRNLLKKSTAGIAAISGMWIFNNVAFALEESKKVAGYTTPDADVLVKAISSSFITGKKTCSESMLNGSCEVLDIRSPLVPDIALGMGGGIGLQGHICGVITGCIMVIGLIVGSRESDYKKKKMRVSTVSGKYLQSFSDEYGTFSCMKITGLDLSTPEGREQLRAGVKDEKCVPVVEGGTCILAKVLRDDEENPSYEPPRSLHQNTLGHRRRKRGHGGW